MLDGGGTTGALVEAAVYIALGTALFLTAIFFPFED